jgi:hypothetical protein
MKYQWELGDVQGGRKVWVPNDTPHEKVIGSTSLSDEGACFHLVNIRGAFIYPPKALDREQLVVYLNANGAYPLD